LKRELNKVTLSSKEIQDYKDEKGFRVFRKELFDFIEKLGVISNCTLKHWQQTTKNNGIDLPIVLSRSDVKVEKLFYYEEVKNQGKYINTIHSVKGMSLDAILVFLQRKDNSNYITIINTVNKETLSSSDSEQMRIVYVALSRPRKLLWLVVPTDDVECWNEYLGLSEQKTIQPVPVQTCLQFE